MESLQRLIGIVGEVDALYHEAALRLGQTDSSMTVLYAALDAGGACALADIRRATGIRKQTLNSALRRLEAEGAVVLEGGARSRRVTLTEAGRALAEATAGRLRQMEDEALAGWTSEELGAYLALSARFRDRFAALVAALPGDGGAR